MDTEPNPSVPPATPLPEAEPAINTVLQPQTDTVSSRAVPPPPPAPKISTPLIIAIAVTALVVSGVLFGLSRIKPKEIAVAPTPTPTPMATPTPMRQPSALAGSAQFMQFRSAVATLSAAIAGYSPQDPTLTPPTLVLPLGFSR